MDIGKTFNSLEELVTKGGIILKAVYARSYKMPTLNSIYVTDYDEEIEDLFREKKPFTGINRKTKTYEITYDIYEKIAHKVDEFADERVTYSVFERKSKEKYGYQEDAVEFARKTNNILINFPQGTGKTLTAMKIITDKKIDKNASYLWAR